MVTRVGRLIQSVWLILLQLSNIFCFPATLKLSHCLSINPNSSFGNVYISLHCAGYSSLFHSHPTLLRPFVVTLLSSLACPGGWHVRAATPRCLCCLTSSFDQRGELLECQRVGRERFGSSPLCSLAGLGFHGGCFRPPRGLHLVGQPLSHGWLQLSLGSRNNTPFPFCLFRTKDGKGIHCF